jgi:hypothetical protein
VDLHHKAQLSWRHAGDGDVEDAADEEVFAADHTEIFRQEIAVEP